MRKGAIGQYGRITHFRKRRKKREYADKREIWDVNHKKILAYIEFVGPKEVTQSEIAQMLGITPTTVAKHIEKLTEEGRVAQIEGTKRVRRKFTSPSPLVSPLGCWEIQNIESILKGWKVKTKFVPDIGYVFDRFEKLDSRSKT